MLKNLLRQLRAPARPAPPAAGALEAQLRGALADEQAGRLAEAEAVYRALLARDSANGDVSHLLGANLLRQGRPADAVPVLERAAAAPASAAALYTLAGALAALGRHGQAAGRLEQALAIEPGFAAALNALGVARMAAGSLDAAEDAFRRALALQPDSAETEHNLGNLLHLEGRVAEAIEAYRRAVALQPGFVTAHSNLIYALNFVPEYGPPEVFAEHRAWARRHADALAEPDRLPARSADPGRRLRVGYVSPNFRDHAVTYFFEPVLASHDATRFEVYCYSDTPQADAHTGRLRGLAAHWRECARLSDVALAEQVRRDGIDILVDLTGHTKDHRLLAFARRPAPLQVTWNGYANTTGMTAMDYRITDALADPPGMTEALHTEQLLRLPETYMVFRPPAGGPAAGPAPAVQSGAITFGSFNAVSKITPEVVRVWSNILHAVAESRLLIAAAPPGRAQERLQELFAANGIGPERLALHGKLPAERFLALHHEADIALDPFPFSGTTTTCHTLWMGVPVVTLAGASHVSRVGASMLTNAGLADMIAQSAGDYVDIAVRLAADRGQLQALHGGLRERLLRSPLTDGPRLTRHLEERFREIWAAWCRRQAG